MYPVLFCENLAERLKLVFRDLVELQLPHLEISAVPTGGRDFGGTQADTSGKWHRVMYFGLPAD